MHIFVLHFKQRYMSKREANKIKDKPENNMNISDGIFIEWLLLNCDNIQKERS